MCRGKLYIDKELKAMDEYGNVISWNKAFPGISPQNVLSQCRVKRVEAYRGSEKVYEGLDLNELVQRYRSSRWR